MKPMKAIFALVLTATLFSFQTSDQKYYLNASASNLHWKAKKTTGEHEGDVKLRSGVLIFKGEELVGGEFAVDMATISVTDIKDAEQNAKLVGHLKSDDFFSVAKNPYAVITIKKFTKNTNGNYTANAKLSIKGISNEISFPIKLTKRDNSSYGATADITIDRTKWDIKYNSKSILGAAADKFIYDDVTFNVNLVVERR